jgi:hypothetical protein
MMAIMRKNLSEGIKKLVAGKQQYRCANRPRSGIIKNYNCPLWNIKDRNGSFGEEGYEIDHIKEVSRGGSNDMNNLQALCLSCHSVKTRRFVSIKPEKKKEEEMLLDKDSSEEYYEVEDILDKRVDNNDVLYLVKWKGYKFSECTWESVNNLNGCKRKIRKFEKEVRSFSKMKN